MLFKAELPAARARPAQRPYSTYTTQIAPALGAGKPPFPVYCTRPHGNRDTVALVKGLRDAVLRMLLGGSSRRVSIIRVDVQVGDERLWLHGLPEDAPTILYGGPSLSAGTRRLALQTTWGPAEPQTRPDSECRRHRTGTRRSAFADASTDASNNAFLLNSHVPSNNRMGVTAGSVSVSMVDLTRHRSLC